MEKVFTVKMNVIRVLRYYIQGICRIPYHQIVKKYAFGSSGCLDIKIVIIHHSLDFRGRHCLHR